MQDLKGVVSDANGWERKSLSTLNAISVGLGNQATRSRYYKELFSSSNSISLLFSVRSSQAVLLSPLIPPRWLSYWTCCEFAYGHLSYITSVASVPDFVGGSYRYAPLHPDSKGALSRRRGSVEQRVIARVWPAEAPSPRTLCWPGCTLIFTTLTKHLKAVTVARNLLASLWPIADLYPPSGRKYLAPPFNPWAEAQWRRL